MLADLTQKQKGYMETKGLKIRWPQKLLPDSFPDPYYSSKHTLTKKKKKKFKQQIRILTLTSAYTGVETIQQVCFLF